MALWKKAAMSAYTERSDARRMYTSDDPAYVQRTVTKYQSQDLKSPDDPVQDGVGSFGVIGGVSQRGVYPPSWHRLHSSDDPTVYTTDLLVFVGGVSQGGVSL